MLYLKRSINPQNLIGIETVIGFKFTEIKDYPNWWMVVKGNNADLCVKDLGKDVDVYFTATVKTMAGIWMWDTSHKKAIAGDALKLVWPKALIKDVSRWVEISVFADIVPASEI